MASGSTDYVAFCGVTTPVSVLAAHERITAQQLASHSKSEDVAILDTREPTQFELCSLTGSINVPWSDFTNRIKSLRDENLDWTQKSGVVVVCKMGNDSQLAARMLRDSGVYHGNIVDLKGGLKAWRNEVDPTWPDT